MPREIEWTVYGIAEQTVSAAIAFEAVHMRILDWSGQFKGVSTRNSYSLGIANRLLTLAEKAIKQAEDNTRQYEDRALPARYNEEDIKMLRNRPSEPTLKLEPDDEMDLDETNNAGDTDGVDDAGNDSDNEVVPNYNERHDLAAPEVTVNIEADFDTELNKFMAPDSVATTDKPGLPSRKDFLDDADAADVVLPSVEEADGIAELEETAHWKSMRQLSH